MEHSSLAIATRDVAVSLSIFTSRLRVQSGLRLRVAVRADGRLLGFPPVGVGYWAIWPFYKVFMKRVYIVFGPRPGLQPGQPRAQIRPCVEEELEQVWSIGCRLCGHH